VAPHPGERAGVRPRCAPAAVVTGVARPSDPGLCGVRVVTGRRLKADKHRVSTETSNTGESYDATRRIRLTDVPGWAGSEASGRPALPVPPRRVPPPAKQAADTVARAVPSRAGQSTGPRARPPLRVVASRRDAGAACTGQLDLTDAAGAATDAADLQRPLSITGRWWSRWWWQQNHGQRDLECDLGSVPSGSQENAAEVKPGGRHRRS
jgi:hypothetical protein